MPHPPAPPASTSVAITHFDVIDSTSLHARREFLAGRLPTVPVAFASLVQTGGIGQHGRAWSSPSGGLWMTLCWPINASDRRFPTTLALALGVTTQRLIAEVLRAADSADQVLLRWPNDIMLRDRKLGGILIECVTLGDRAELLVGVGINVNVATAALDPALSVTAISIADVIAASAASLALGPLCEQLVAALARTLTNPPTDAETVAAARAIQWGVGRQVRITVPGGGTEGQAGSIGGGDGNEHTIVTGEIQGLSASGELLACVNGVPRVISSVGQVVHTVL